MLCVCVCATDDDRMLRIAVNDVIIRHDALWPRGLNELLYVETLLEVAELRLSCLRHRWPPADADLQPRETQLNLPRLRARLQQHVVAQSPPDARSSAGNATATATKKAGVGAPRAGVGRPASTSVVQHTSPTKPTQQQQQSTKPILPTPNNRRPATTTKSNSASSPTKTPRSRPKSAPKPQPSVSTSPRQPSQPSTGTPHSRPKSAKSTTGGVDGSGSKPSRSSTAECVAASSAEAESTNTSDATSSVNGPSLCQPDESTEHTAITSTAESSDLVFNTRQNEPGDCATTVASYHQMPATATV